MRFTRFGCTITCADVEHCINLVFTYSFTSSCSETSGLDLPSAT